MVKRKYKTAIESAKEDNSPTGIHCQKANDGSRKESYTLERYECMVVGTFPINVAVFGVFRSNGTKNKNKNLNWRIIFI